MFNNCFFAALCLIVLRWFDEPDRLRWPCLLSFVFGVGITNHQTLLVSAPAFLFAIFLIHRLLFRDIALLGSMTIAIFAWQSHIWFLWFLVAPLLFFHIGMLISDFHSKPKQDESWFLRNIISTVFSLTIGCLAMCLFTDDKSRITWLAIAGFLFFVIIAALIFDISLQNHALKSIRPFLLSFVLFGLGSSFYLYMPLSSHTNPPMNWGYTKTAQGFRHHITRGQYEKIHADRSASVIINQYKEFFVNLEKNFSFPLCIMALLPLAFILQYPRRHQAYMGFMIMCFIFMGLVLVYLLNPKFDLQSRSIIRVFYHLCHGIFSVWIGLGSLFLLNLCKRIPSRRGLWLGAGFSILATALLVYTKHQVHPILIWLEGSILFVVCLNILLEFESSHLPAIALICTIPLIPLQINWAGSEQRHHDFGWRYGHDMLINLDKNAVVYGGTDPGRFVPTYMIFVDSFQPKKWKRDPNFDRRDLYIITQNALADNTYMNYIRDHYDINRPKMDQWYHKLLGRDQLYPKEPLSIPNEAEFTQIFNAMVEQASKQPNSGVVFEKDSSGNTRATVQGIEGVFAINGAIAEWIFHKNKDKHTFYVEESFPIMWMYPYMEPAGLIMKLNKEPIKQISPDVIRRDALYWHRLLCELLANPAFCRDELARKSFSKLRSSIGRLYAWRGMLRDAERVFNEALEFYGASAEARSGLTSVLLSQGRADEAVRICEEWYLLDPLYPPVMETLKNAVTSRELLRKEAECRSFYESSKGDPEFIFRFADVLRGCGKTAESDKLIDELLAKNPDAIYWQKALDFYAAAGRLDRMETVLKFMTQKNPKYPLAWYNLAVIHAALQRGKDACSALEKALRLDTNMLQTARTDPRFNQLRIMDGFQKLIQ